jgi:cytochrome oxidase assembly protein ShyY1
MDARIIAPREEIGVTRRGTLWIGWTLALLAMAGFARLGFWQYARMHEKQALLAQVDRVMRDRQAMPLDRDPGDALAWVEGDARIAAPTLLLDNQLRDGQPGVHVYCIAQAGTAHRLVDFGWVAVKPDRTMPEVTCPEGPLHVRGLSTALPSSGVRMGSALQQIGPSRWLMVRADADAIDAALHVDVPPRVVRLDPELKIGWARNLDVLPNTLPPERHLGYAVQWWALSAAVLVTALVLTFRKKKQRTA